MGLTPWMEINGLINRRQLLKGLLTATLVPQVSWASIGAPSYLLTGRDQDGGFKLFGMSSKFEELFKFSLPGRGHAVVAHPEKPEAIIFARRPGMFGIVFNCQSGKPITNLELPTGRHFYGHGVFLNNGKLLCTTENCYETGLGKIGIWDTNRNYKRIGEIPSWGIGPHEISKLDDNDLLVIANGGIRTHPNSGRTKLNVGQINSNLSYSTIDGELRDQMILSPRMRGSSIRHIDVSQSGVVAFAMQHQKSSDYLRPLLGTHKLGQSCKLLNYDNSAKISMGGYLGSIAISRKGDRVGITAPRGGMVQIISVDGRLLKSWRHYDCCGISCSKENGFMITTGTGSVFKVSDTTEEFFGEFDYAWDNHLTVL